MGGLSAAWAKPRESSRTPTQREHGHHRQNADRYILLRYLRGFKQHLGNTVSRAYLQEPQDSDNADDE